MTKPTIYFDLDGTVYDLYSIPEWLERITIREDATAYAEGDMLVDRDTLHQTLDRLLDAGHKVGVITWLAGDWDMPNGFSREYIASVRRTKRAWVAENLPQASEVHIVKHGTPKHRIAKNAGILVDDNAEVRAKWNKGLTIDANGDIIKSLNDLLG